MYRQMTLRTQQEYYILYNVHHLATVYIKSIQLYSENSKVFLVLFIFASTYNLYMHKVRLWEIFLWTKISYIKAVRPNKVKAPLWKPDYVYIQTNKQHPCI